MWCCKDESELMEDRAMTLSRPELFSARGLRAGVMLLCAGGLLAVPVASGAAASRAGAWIVVDDAKSVFFDGTHDEALAEVAGTDRVLVLYFTASWCGPCQRMQRTTWVDERVVERFTTDGLVVKIDVDEQRELAQRYRVRAMPTMLALRDGKEVDRVVGMRTAEQMLEWLGKAQGLEPGEVVEPEPVAEDDVDARYERAKQLLMKGQHEEALRDYLWLWENIPTRRPSMMAVRTSFMTGDIGELASAYKPAHAAFSEKRDEAFEKLGRPGWGHWDVNEFVSLNEALGEDEVTLKWYEMLRDDEANERMLGFASTQLVRLLIERERYAEAGRLIQNPVRSAQMMLPEIVASTKGLAERLGDDTAMIERLLRDTAERQAREITALFAADRDGEATRVAAIVVKELGVLGREVLAEVALKAGYVRPLHLSLLENIEEDERPDGYEDLVAKVREALAAQQG